MHVIVTGATGLIGRRLCAVLQGSGHRVTALSRDAERARRVLPQGVSCLTWGGHGSGSADDWEAAVAAADAVVHLAGEPVAGRRWSKDFKETFKASRVQTTRDLVRVIRQDASRPRAFVCASAVGYYGDRGDETLDERSPPGDDFLAGVCVEWEAAATSAAGPATRVAMMRIGIVLASEGGPLPEMLYPLPVRVSPWKLGLGGRLGSGRQWVPWVHVEDAVGLLAQAVEDDRLSGPVNVTAPEPVRNATLARAIGRALHRPPILPVPGWVLSLAMGEVAYVLLTGQRVLPAAANAAGYEFRYRDIDAALRSLLPL